MSNPSPNDLEFEHKNLLLGTTRKRNNSTMDQQVLAEHEEFMDELDAMICKIFANEKKFSMDEYSKAYTYVKSFSLLIL